MRQGLLWVVAVAGVSVGSAAAAAASGVGNRPRQAPMIAPPPGAERVLAVDRVDGQTVVCATTGEPSVRHENRALPPTGIWIGTDRQLRRLEVPPFACDPAWSPDGGSLAFTTPDGLWVLADVEAGEPRLLLAAPEPSEETEFGYVAFRRPVWSPNGARIGYLATNGGTTWVEVVEVVDGRLRFRSAEETYAFSWGADSRSLLIGGNTVLVP